MRISRLTVSAGLVIAAATALAVGIAEQPAMAGTATIADQVSRSVAANRDGGNIGGPATISIRNDRPSALLNSAGNTVGVAFVGAPASARSVASTRLYGNVALSTDAAIRIGSSWVQLLSIMRNSSAPTTQRFQLALPAGARLQPSGAGFLIVRDGRTIANVAAPWAADATGRSLPTVYALDGDVLLQRTDTTGAVYPIVADPRITIGIGVYLNLWGSELKTYYSAILAVGGAGVAFSCTLTGQLPFPLNGLAAILCAYVGASIVKHIFAAVVSIVSGGGINDGSCYQIKLNLTDHFKRVGLSNCSG